MALWSRLLLATTWLAAVSGGGYLWATDALPNGDEPADGVVLDGQPATHGRIDQLEKSVLDRTITIVFSEQIVLTTSARLLGATTNAEQLKQRALFPGHQAKLVSRWAASRLVAGDTLPLKLMVTVPASALAASLGDFKARVDARPTPSRIDRTTDSATPHKNGRLVDVYATAEAIRADLMDPQGDGRVAIALRPVHPRATQAVVSRIDQNTVVSTYQTVFAYTGGKVGRAQNVMRAAEGIDGLVMMPGQVVSFNDTVGPRSIENGFATAGEIYKGEMRQGIGGGTCQVASTFHAAVYTAGLEVVNRSPHSRPSGYIPVGLDATVAYPHVDLLMRNPLPFPVVVYATVERGLLTIELRGQKRPYEVAYTTETVGVRRYKRRVRPVNWLEPGTTKRKQKGSQGLTIRKRRVIRGIDGEEWTETTKDVYPPTNEVLYVGPGVDESSLPPVGEAASG